MIKFCELLPPVTCDRIDVLTPEPVFSFPSPSIQHAVWHRIIRAKCDEAENARLQPMRQFTFEVGVVVIAVEEMEFNHAGSLREHCLGNERAGA